MLKRHFVLSTFWGVIFIGMIVLILDVIFLFRPVFIFFSYYVTKEAEIRYEIVTTPTQLQRNRNLNCNWRLAKKMTVHQQQQLETQQRYYQHQY